MLQARNFVADPKTLPELRRKAGVVCITGDPLFGRLAMSEDNDAARDKREMRLMWGFSAAIVLLIVGGMAANMIWGHHDPATEPPSDISSQSRSTPAN